MPREPLREWRMRIEEIVALLPRLRRLLDDHGASDGSGRSS
jgi:hypothetical protein